MTSDLDNEGVPFSSTPFCCLISSSTPPALEHFSMLSRLPLVVILFLALLSRFAAQDKKSAERKSALSPADAAKTFKVPDDLRVDQVLAEPLVKQPLSLSFDEKGRLWVMNYEQYPYPAGLNILSGDKYWRLVYAKITAPPTTYVRGK